jgi:CheY-like chemotaxis protein
MIGTPIFPDLCALVVDESLYVRRIVRDMLTRTGIRRVMEAPDGAEALGVLAESKPDLMILDWDLAILSGEEVIRLTRDYNTSPAPSVTMILMLAQPRKDRVERAIRLGVNEIIAKPFSPKTMWSRLDEVINRPRSYTMVKNLLHPQPRARLGTMAACPLLRIATAP